MVPAGLETAIGKERESSPHDTLQRDHSYPAVPSTLSAFLHVIPLPSHSYTPQAHPLLGLIDILAIELPY